jgi:hypothetical protein
MTKGKFPLSSLVTVVFEVDLLLRYKLPPRFVVSFSTQQTFADLPQGDFVARVHTLRLDYALSPFLTLFNLAA